MVHRPDQLRWRPQDSPVVVPPPGDQAVANPCPTANSPRPFLGGWGSVGLTQRVEPVKEKVTISAAGYSTLVQSEYEAHVPAEERGDVPFGVFQYSMMYAWWRRVLATKKKNFVLSDEEAEVLAMLEGIRDLWVTPKIADYLSLVGSFTKDEIEFQFTIESDYSGRSAHLKTGGFVGDSDGVQVNGDTMWHYAHRPAPGVLVIGLWKDLGPRPGKTLKGFDFLKDIRPSTDVFPGSQEVQATALMVGWNPNHDGDARICVGSEERSAGLVTSDGRWKCYTDCVTAWRVSPSVFRYVKSTLLELGVPIVDFFSMNPSLDGSPLQLSFLCVDFKSASRGIASDLTLPNHPLLVDPIVAYSGVITNETELSVMVGCGFGFSLGWVRAPTGLVVPGPFVGITESEVIGTPPALLRNADLTFGVSSLPMRHTFIHCTGTDRRYHLLLGNF